MTVIFEKKKMKILIFSENALPYWVKNNTRLLSLHTSPFFQVHTLGEGHKIWKNLPPVLTKQLFLLSSVKTSDFFKFLWPFQKSWTLTKPAQLFVNFLHLLNSILTKCDVFQLQVWVFTITWLPTVRPAFYESAVITIITVIEEVLFLEFLLWAALVPTQKNTDLSQKWTLFLINTATVMKLF